MKRKLIFLIPALLLFGFLAIKPPAIGSDTEQVVVTPTSTTTALPKPKLRDFDDEGHGPKHFRDHDRDDRDDHEGRELHESDDD